jgi:hypothetical protein
MPKSPRNARTKRNQKTLLRAQAPNDDLSQINDDLFPVFDQMMLRARERLIKAASDGVKNE